MAEEEIFFFFTIYTFIYSSVSFYSSLCSSLLHSSNSSFILPSTIPFYFILSIFSYSRLAAPFRLPPAFVPCFGLFRSPTRPFSHLGPDSYSAIVSQMDSQQAFSLYHWLASCNILLLPPPPLYYCKEIDNLFPLFPFHSIEFAFSERR